MKIALLGGSGFIGSHLTDALLPEHELLVFDLRLNPRFAAFTVQGDVRDFAALQAQLKGCDAIVLLAAEHKDNVSPPELYYDVNVGGAHNVARVASELGIKMILFTSSVAVYGPSDNESSEETVPAPHTDYGKSKLQAEEALTDWAARDPERLLIIVRPTVVFGPGNRGNVYNLFCQIASGKFFMIGDGGNRKSMAYVENVAAFLRHCLSRFSSGIHTINYADKPDYTMCELVATVRAALGMKPPRISLPVGLAALMAGGLSLAARMIGKETRVTAQRVRKFSANTRFSSRLPENLSFTPPVSLLQGINITLANEFSAASPPAGKHDA